MNSTTTESGLPENANASVLDRVRTLVESKTRFEPKDITAIKEEDSRQSYGIKVGYQLFTNLIQLDINGNFRPTKDDVEYNSSLNLISNATAETQDLMSQAGQKLAQDLSKEGLAYNALSSGSYLLSVRRHFHLPTCSDCHGQGRNTCHTCYGRCTETCPQCSGNRQIPCTNYSCSFGKTNCTYCHGTGSITEYKTEYVTVNYQVNNADGSFSHYGSKTEPVSSNVTVPCRNFSCQHGKVTCSTCNGNAKINCPRCNAQGSITCRTCTGAGYLTCQPCDGTGKHGDATRLQVRLEVHYDLQIPEGTPDDARQISEKEGLHGLPKVSFRIGRNDLQMTSDGASATYAGEFAISRLNAACNSNNYNVVAYGQDKRWFTMDNIVEDLLRSDLNQLSSALKRIEGEGFFEKEIDFLLEPLSQVTSSEINTDVVESVLDKASAQATKEMQSKAAKQLTSTKKQKMLFWAGVLIGSWFIYGQFWGMTFWIMELLLIGVVWKFTLPLPSWATPKVKNAAPQEAKKANAVSSKDMDQMVSAEYKEEIQAGILGSLKHIYTRSAKPLVLNLFAMSVVISIVMCYFYKGFIATITALCLIPITNWIFKRKVHERLLKAMSSPENVERAIAIAIANGTHRKAQWLLFTPIIAGIPVGFFLLVQTLHLLWSMK